MPAGTGKNVKVIAFTDDEVLQKEALEAGATKAALEDLIAEVEGGFLDFDYVVATPDAMKKMSKIAKILGPRGLMPNPKNGNITNELGKVVKLSCAIGDELVDGKEYSLIVEEAREYINQIGGFEKFAECGLY